jgi:2-polyprenyl-3-methyl-5-hydroxy-6-metoxy-1,4-benzoquinol methylase
LRRIVQTAGDLLGYPFDGRRVLDLACLEGQLAIEFALQGANVVAIEGGAVNLEKAKFAADALGLKNVELLLGDVRDLSVKRHGKFDLILCLGILYHLDAPDVMEFVQRIADSCQ